MLAARLSVEGPSALVSVEPSVVDIGTPGARSFLGEGWHYDEHNPTNGDTFVWSDGSASEFVFHLGWRRDLTLIIECRPFQFPGAPAQEIELELNGRTVGPKIELRRGRARYSAVLPAGDQVVGRNRLVARYVRVDRPFEVTEGATDERELAVAWSSIELLEVDSSPVIDRQEEIHLPAGSQTDLFFELTGGGRIEIENCLMASDGGAVVEVSVLGEAEDEAEIAVWTCPGGPRTLELGSREGLTRLRLATRPTDDTASPTGIILRRPMILTAPREDVPEAPLSVAADPPKAHRPNVIIYLVDALRADRLGVYGCDRPLSPRLDAVAEQAVTFTDAVAQSSWTKAAVASIFTGIWPRAHGVNGPDDRLPEGLSTLPELLRQAGYRTGAVVANAYVGRPFGFARGFDHFEFIEHTRGRSHVIHERIESWLEALPEDDRPFFLYVHTIDPHAPYAPPPSFREAFASMVDDPSVGGVETVRGLVIGTVDPTPDLGRDLRNLYDAEIAANDASFGRLIDRLEALGKLDDTVVVFTSDHGEAFGEHGTWTHGLDLYSEVLSIPLVIRLPGGAGGGQRVSAPVQHIDLMPTILGLCAVEAEDDLPGEVLLDRTGRAGVGEDRTILAYLDYWGRKGAAAHRGGWKLIQPLSPAFGPTTELYFREQDRDETNDLAAVGVVRRDWLRARLETALEMDAAGVPTDVDADTRAQLEALGYLH
jgi:arylsulfatase A-like enzyme